MDFEYNLVGDLHHFQVAEIGFGARLNSQQILHGHVQRRSQILPPDAIQQDIEQIVGIAWSAFVSDNSPRS